MADGGCVAAVQGVDEFLHRETAALGGAQIHRRQRRIEVLREEEIVAASQSNVLRDAEAALFQMAEDTQGTDIVDGDDGGWQGLVRQLRQHPRGTDFAGLRGEAGGKNILLLRRHAKARHFLTVHGDARIGEADVQAAADERNPPMPQIRQVRHHLADTLEGIRSNINRGHPLNQRPDGNDGHCLVQLLQVVQNHLRRAVFHQTACQRDAVRTMLQ